MREDEGGKGRILATNFGLSAVPIRIPNRNRNRFLKKKIKKNLRVFIKELLQQEEYEILQSKDIQFAAVKLPK